MMDSKTFDNSILCTNESCVIVEQRCAEPRARAGRHGAHVLAPDERPGAARSSSPTAGSRSTSSARTRAGSPAEAGIRVPGGTRVLVAPFELVVPEEPLAREKLFPLLGLVRVPTPAGIEAARAMLRIGGAGHSAVIHSRSAQAIMAYGAAVQVLRVASTSAAAPARPALTPTWRRR